MTDKLLIFGLSTICRKCKGQGYVVAHIKDRGRWHSEKTWCPQCKGNGYVNVLPSSW